MKNEKPLTPIAERKDHQAKIDGETRRQDYLSTLDPRQREALDPEEKA